MSLGFGSIISASGLIVLFSGSLFCSIWRSFEHSRPLVSGGDSDCDASVRCLEQLSVQLRLQADLHASLRLSVAFTAWAFVCGLVVGGAVVGCWVWSRGSRAVVPPVAPSSGGVLARGGPVEARPSLGSSPVRAAESPLSLAEFADRVVDPSSFSESELAVYVPRSRTNRAR
jgi:hypothetical protein